MAGTRSTAGIQAAETIPAGYLMRILTSEEVRQAEREAINRPGLSTLVLMHRAGHAVTQFCLAHFNIQSVCVVCGKGNNGGVGLAAAEALRKIAAQTFVIILAKEIGELSADATAMCSRLSLQPIWIADESDFDTEAAKEALGADLIVDAIMGGGYKPPLTGLAAKAVEAINDAFGTIVSVDVPSGVEADARAQIHQTHEYPVFTHGIITFVAPKPAHIFGELTSGPIAVSELGAQPALVPNKTELQVITGQEVGITFPPRLNDAHKEQFGHVLVIGGSLGKAGAAGLAGLAALRTGAGLVTLACPRPVQATVAGFAPELMIEDLPETPEGTISTSAGERVNQLLPGKDVIVLGAGLSLNENTAEFVRRLVTGCPLPLVLDADGLIAFYGHYEELKARSDAAPFRVLTLHPGEAAQLIGISTGDIQANRIEMARRICRETGCCIVLKGWRTIVAGASGETWINMSGNPALAKGGSGNVLSGMIGAALATQQARSLPLQTGGRPELQPSKSWMHEIDGTDSREKVRRHEAQQLKQNAARAAAFLKDVSVAAAVYLQGAAADIARDQLHENTVLAGDVLENLSEAFDECDLQMDQALFYLQR
jgi:ADP-dependent NAD(P)H-hydrate dehydratase / NAD(P)H-hydrate epimerase